MLGSVPSSNFTQEVIDNVLLAKAMQHRVSTVITGSFNIVTAILVLASILWNAHSSKGSALDLRLPFYRRIVHSTQIFPFFTSMAVIIQGVAFVGVQSSALSVFGVNECRATAELIWPAVWLFSFTVFAFGLETAVRSIRRNGLCARGTWETWLTLGFITLLTLMMWLSSFLLPADDNCIGSLVWWTENYALIAIVLIPVIILINSVTSTIIIIQLLRTTKVDRKERIMASRVVYTIVLSIVLLALLLPYYVEVFTNRISDSFTNPTIVTTSDIADIALNLPGIVNAVLHIMLVHNYDRIAIQSRRDITKKTSKAQLLGPAEFDAKIMTPISPPIGPSGPSDLALIGADSGWVPSRPNTVRTRYTETQVPLPRPSSFAKLPASPQREMWNQARYSIFPTGASQRPISWSTIPTRSDHESVQLPPPLFASRYSRNNSDDSSATVQIGLRLSGTGEEESSSPDLLYSPRQDTWDTPTRLRRNIPSISEYSEESPESPPTTPRLHTSVSCRSVKRNNFAALSGQWEEQRQMMMIKSLPPVSQVPSPTLPPAPRLNQSPLPPIPPLLQPGILSTSRLYQLLLPPIPPPSMADLSSNPRYTVTSIGLPASPRPFTMMSIGLPPTPRLSIPRLPAPRIVDPSSAPTASANWSSVTRNQWI